jgi:toxin ParE1/3/4
VTPRRPAYAPRYFRRLEDIYERIAADNPTAANRMIERIRAAVTHLAASPALGRSGRVAGTRELVIPHTPYLSPIGSKVTSFRLSRYCTAPSDGLTACPEWRDRTALSACTIDSPHICNYRLSSIPSTLRRFGAPIAHELRGIGRASSTRERHRLNCHNRMVFRSESGRVE